MFKLTEMEKLESFDVDAYFQALLFVANADNVLLNSEAEFLSDQARLFNYNLDGIVDREIDIKRLRTSDMSIFTKKIIIRDCIAMAYVDGNYDKREKEAVQEICKLFMLPFSEVEKIEQWLYEYWSVIEKGQILFTS